MEVVGSKKKKSNRGKEKGEGWKNWERRRNGFCC